MKLPYQKILINLAKISLVAGILYYLIETDKLNFERLFLFLEHPSTLALLVLVQIFWIVPLAAGRWWLLLKAIGLEVPIFRANVLTWIGNFFNTTLPGAVSGDLVKGYYIVKAQEKEGKTRAFTTVLIDRFVGLFGLIVMAFLALVFNLDFILGQPALFDLAIMIFALFAGTVVFYGIVIFPFKEGKDPFIRLFAKLPGSKVLIKVYQAFKTYQNQKLTLVYTLLMSVVLHCSVAFLFFQVAQMIGVQDLNLGTQLFIMPIGLIAIAVPVAPGGLGIGHAAFGVLYDKVGIAGGADIFNLYIIIQLSVYLLGLFPYLFYRSEYKLPDEAEAEAMLNDEATPTDTTQNVTLQEETTTK